MCTAYTILHNGETLLLAVDQSGAHIQFTQNFRKKKRNDLLSFFALFGFGPMHSCRSLHLDRTKIGLRSQFVHLGLQGEEMQINGVKPTASRYDFISGWNRLTSNGNPPGPLLPTV